MTYSEIIESAYADGLRNVFNVYVENLVIAEIDEQKTEAFERLKNGVALLKHCRDKALTLGD